MAKVSIVSDFQIDDKAYHYMSNNTLRVFNITDNGAEYARTVCPNTCEFQKVISEAIKIGFRLF